MSGLRAAGGVVKKSAKKMGKGFSGMKQRERERERGGDESSKH